MCFYKGDDVERSAQKTGPVLSSQLISDSAAEPRCQTVAERSTGALELAGQRR